jgi:hypothetical protein
MASYTPTATLTTRARARTADASAMDKNDPPIRHGVFMPVGHVVISFPNEADLHGAELALRGLGLDNAAFTAYTPDDMQAQARTDIDNATGLASLGQDLNLVKAHLVLAEAGYHFLVVETADDDLARRVADTAKGFNAERAQHYGNWIIEELIEHPDDEPQVAESPDRGLDAQTPSGLEVERVQRHREP